MHNHNQSSVSLSVGGFALPTVLIASIILLTVLIATVGASTSVRVSINSQYYNQMAREATESGLARARECLEANSFVAQWDNTNQLRPNTSCNGGPACTSPSGNPPCFVVSDTTLRTTFRVEAPQVLVSSQIVNIVGQVELLRKSDGSVWKTITSTTKANLSSGIAFTALDLGYSGVCNQPGCSFYFDTRYANFVTLGLDGVARTVGSNLYGQLGNGTFTDSTVPQTFQMPLSLSGDTIEKVFTNFSSNGFNIFAITSSGQVIGAGRNTEGQLGDGTTTNRNTPVIFPIAYAPNERPRKVIVGRNTFVLTEDTNTGEPMNIYASGWCYSGAIGTGGWCDSPRYRTTPARVLLPVYNPADPSTQPTDQISVDGDNGFVVMKSGHVYGWGQNGHGQQALPPDGSMATQYGAKYTPIRIWNFGDSEPDAVKIATDSMTTYVIDENQEAWSFGRGSLGQRCDNTNILFRHTPQIITGMVGDVLEVQTDQLTVFFRTIQGVNQRVYGCGYNAYGVIGNGNTNNRNRPTQFDIPVAGVRPVAMYHSSNGDFDIPNNINNTYVIGTDGKVYGSGRNDFGQLGTGTTSSYEATPQQMQLTGVLAQKVMSGYGTTVVFTTGNKVYTVGNNSNGQLGDGTTTNRSVPAISQFLNYVPLTKF